MFRRKQWRYEYYVMYVFKQKNGATGTGSMRVNLNKKIRTFEDIRAVEGYIREDSDFSYVLLVTWKRVKMGGNVSNEGTHGDAGGNGAAQGAGE